MSIENGCILIARRMIGSDIWNKPADYLKIWLYILLKVNHTNTYSFKRGENFFCWSDDIRDLKGIKLKTVYNCLNYLKSSNQISTRKTTRGMIIEVNNYGLYQDLQNYYKKDELAQTQEVVGKQMGITRHSINNNDNNVISIYKYKETEFFNFSLTEKEEKDLLGIYTTLCIPEGKVQEFFLNTLISYDAYKCRPENENINDYLTLRSWISRTNVYNSIQRTRTQKFNTKSNEEVDYAKFAKNSSDFE